VRVLFRATLGELFADDADPPSRDDEDPEEAMGCTGVLARSGVEAPEAEPEEVELPMILLLLVASRSGREPEAGRMGGVETCRLDLIGDIEEEEPARSSSDSRTLPRGDAI
jgi:hypothetical protein